MEINMEIGRKERKRKRKWKLIWKGKWKEKGKWRYVYKTTLSISTFIYVNSFRRNVFFPLGNVFHVRSRLVGARWPGGTFTPQHFCTET